MKIRKNDQIKIIAGKDRGKSGKVLKVFAAEGKILVEGLNLIKKHVRPRKEGEKGQRIEIPARINSSNALVVCPKCGKATRVSHKKSGDNKMRACRKCGSDI